MGFIEEFVVPAAMADIIGRLFSFLIDKVPWPSLPGARDEHRRRLERLLGNIATVVEEAEGRHITNHQLLARLKVLTQGMYRGRFVLEVSDLDNAMNSIGNVDADDTVTTTTTTGKRSLALRSSLDVVKRARLTSVICGSRATNRRLATTVDELEGLTHDYMTEFIMLVNGYPRNVCRSVTTTLYMHECVFGRHVEKERIVNFLLQREPAGRAPYVSVLAVVGAENVGKTTLVKHACDDERLRDHFVRIEWFEFRAVFVLGRRPNQTSHADQTMRESDGSEYLSGVRCILDKPRFAEAGPYLLVFDDARFIDESAWATLVSSPSALAEGSKILFTSRNADLGRIGTVEPVVLGHLSKEEYWYYFKAFAFGGADPRDHPRIAAVAREISNHLESSFFQTRVMGTLLRNNFNVQFWRGWLNLIVKCKFWPFKVGALPQLQLDGGRLRVFRCRHNSPTRMSDLLRALESFLLGRMGDDSDDGFIVHLYKDTLYMDRWYIIGFTD